MYLPSKHMKYHRGFLAPISTVTHSCRRCSTVNSYTDFLPTDPVGVKNPHQQQKNK